MLQTKEIREKPKESLTTVTIHCCMLLQCCVGVFVCVRRCPVSYAPLPLIWGLHSIDHEFSGLDASSPLWFLNRVWWSVLTNGLITYYCTLLRAKLNETWLVKGEPMKTAACLCSTNSETSMNMISLLNMIRKQKSDWTRRMKDVVARSVIVYYRFVPDNYSRIEIATKDYKRGINMIKIMLIGFLLLLVCFIINYDFFSKNNCIFLSVMRIKPFNCLNVNYILLITGYLFKLTNKPFWC